MRQMICANPLPLRIAVQATTDSARLSTARKLAFHLLAPTGRPRVKADAVAEDDVGIHSPADERRPELDRAQLPENLLVDYATAANEFERSLARQQITEEELQQPLVANRDAELGVGQPLLEVTAPLPRQAVDGSRASPARSS